MAHIIKLNRARKLAVIGKYSQTWNAVIAAMPLKLKQQCTAVQIAMIADAMYSQHHVGQSVVQS